MRNIYDVIREKEATVEQLQKELEALRIAARILSEDSNTKKTEVREPARPMRPSAPIAPATDTEVVLSPPLRQFP
jgi:hypothetical protein